MLYHDCVVVHCYENGHLLIICVNMSYGCDKCCELRKNKKLKRMYHFEGRVVRRDGHYYRGSCCTPRRMHVQIWVPD
uniref:Putative ovule protein n=1 Tax=Solanum chacoense TaxID=4108 RepID=A0A0V0GT64_SOLCH